MQDCQDATALHTTSATATLQGHNSNTAVARGHQLLCWRMMPNLQKRQPCTGTVHRAVALGISNKEAEQQLSHCICDSKYQRTAHVAAARCGQLVP
jgi:hypothetical protein